MSQEREDHKKAALEILRASPGVQGAVLIVLLNEKTTLGYKCELASDLPANTRDELLGRVADAVRGQRAGLILAH
jgi:hypothetical protein